MIELCIYGDEKLDDEAIQILEDIEKEPINEIFLKIRKLDPEESAENFVNLAAKLDYRWCGKDEDYIKNAVALMNESIKPGFYEALIKTRDSFENLPKRINMVVSSQ